MLDYIVIPDSHIVAVQLEEVLPGRFGGSPVDYQLVEGEDDEGQPYLELLVHPALGPMDEGDVQRTFLSAISQGSGAARVMGLSWQGRNLVSVKRRPPLVSQSGKVLHLHTLSGRGSAIDSYEGK